MNEVLKDNEGKILNPNIPRYEKLKNKMDDVLKFQEFGVAVEIGANYNGSVNMGKVKTPEGYTYLGIVSNNNGYGDQWQVTYSKYGENVYAYIKSYHGATLTSGVHCRVIFVKTDYYSLNKFS